MIKAVATFIDRQVIRAAAAALGDDDHDCHVSEAAALMARREFMDFKVTPPEDFVESSRGRFSAFEFSSAIRSPWPTNNIVKGRFYRAGQDWRARPATILLHGWNGERGYDWQFPFLARRLNHFGVNAAMLELPYHAQRKPADPGAVRNFISGDLLRMVEATRQALADIRALAAWLLAQGVPAVGVWGVSLGSWFGGLAASYDPSIRFAVFLSPVVQMDQAVHELEFCAPIRRSLAGHDISLEAFNLAVHPPAADPRHVLIVQSMYDVFAPAETVEALWRVWGRPTMWKEPHGHITILASVPVLERIVRWVAQTSKALPADRHG